MAQAKNAKRYIAYKGKDHEIKKASSSAGPFPKNELQMVHHHPNLSELCAFACNNKYIDYKGKDHEIKKASSPAGPFPKTS